MIRPLTRSGTASTARNEADSTSARLPAGASIFGSPSTSVVVTGWPYSTAIPTAPDPRGNTSPGRSGPRSPDIARQTKSREKGSTR